MSNDINLEEISKLIKQPVKRIQREGQLTIIEFEDGQTLPLYGNTSEIQGIKAQIHECSFCGTVGTKEKPVVSLNRQNDPLICSKCASFAIELFVKNGIEVELDISQAFSKETIEKLLNIGN